MKATWWIVGVIVFGTGLAPLTGADHTNEVDGAGLYGTPTVQETTSGSTRKPVYVVGETSFLRGEDPHAFLRYNSETPHAWIKAWTEEASDSSTPTAAGPGLYFCWFVGGTEGQEPALGHHEVDCNSQCWDGESTYNTLRFDVPGHLAFETVGGLAWAYYLEPGTFSIEQLTACTSGSRGTLYIDTNT